MPNSMPVDARGLILRAEWLYLDHFAFVWRFYIYRPKEVQNLLLGILGLWGVLNGQLCRFVILALFWVVAVRGRVFRGVSGERYLFEDYTVSIGTLYIYQPFFLGLKLFQCFDSRAFARHNGLIFSFTSGQCGLLKTLLRLDLLHDIKLKIRVTLLMPWCNIFRSWLNIIVHFLFRFLKILY